MRRITTILILMLLTTIVAQAQTAGRIKIGGNVYGGGNQAKVGGNTTVNVRKGDAQKVFGGARMADVGGRTFVNIDGKNASGDVFITEVYGGNDIAGTVGQSGEATTVPSELENVIPEPTDEQLAATGKTREQWRADYKKAHPKTNDIDNTWKTFVTSSRSAKTEGEGESAKTVENYAMIVGSLFGGGNGDYDYEQSEPEGGKVTHYIYKKDDNSTPIATKVTDADDVGFQQPIVNKTYLELRGADIAHVYGGGNNATVTENTTINIDNESQTLTDLIKSYATTLWSADPDKVSDLTAEGEHTFKYYADYTFDYLKSRVGLNMFQSHIDNTDFNFARIFGGNNKAEMAIRPTWNLQQGYIRDLYSGGNKGNMTSPEGLLLEIDPVESDKLVVDNVFGGCRMADVIPTVNGVYTPCSNLPGYNFPNDLSARVLVRGGDINNVYGGNDITGNVKGGNAIGIYSSIRGDVYGGGNGAYAYTNNDNFKDDDSYSDFYFDVGSTSIMEALNAHRPHAEQVSIRIAGKAPANPGDQPTYTSIHGSIYCGGNCATLKTVKPNPMVELKIGSYAIADKVFLGNNGAKMVDEDILKLYAGKTIENYFSLSLTNSTTFANYMKGAAMDLQPSIVFDSKDNQDPDDYKDFTSYVGSFFCGGNVGSMIIPGINTYKVSRGLNIYNKFVGGCNNAYVPVIKDENGEALNAAYDGGILGSEEEQNDYTEVVDGKTKIKDRLEISLDNLTITPLRWDDETNTHLIWNTNKWKDYSLIEAGTVLAVDDVYYTYNTSTEEYEKHTASSEITVGENDKYYELYQDFEPVENNTVNTFYPVKDGTQLTEGETYYTSESSTSAFVATGNEKADDTHHYYTREHEVRLLGGNVYGGCYNSGHVNGNIVVNINEDVLKRDEVFGYGTSELYGRDKSGVSFLDQRDDLNAVALIVFGGGYGEDSEVWGSTTVNLNSGYVFQICGGGEKGIVGKGETKTKTVENEEVTYKDYSFDLAYSSTVNLKGSVTATSSDEVVDGLAESEYLYGGGKEGLVCGNTYVNLGNGRIYDAFAGASEADVLGHTELYIGRQPNGTPGTYKNGFPWISDNVYGSNDFCGKIHGNYETGYDFTKRIENYDTKKSMLHGFKGAIPDVMKSATYVEYLAGRVDTIFGGSYGFYDYKDVGLYGEDCSMPQQKNTFVNIRPRIDDRNAIKVVFGGGTGYPKNREGDKMQDRSYVLIDIPDGVTKFKDTEIFGAGSYNGLGMNYKVADTFKDEFGPDSLSAIIDLLHGEIGAVYGGSFNEGVTARTVINVPAASTIKLNDIFGGAYGTQILPPCDVFESNVNYNSNDATVTGAIYGGNNNERRTLYTHVNITAPVWSNKEKGYTATVYGAGNGVDTWSEYTEVNLRPKPEGVVGDYTGAMVYEVYGGGKMGHVLNAESVQKYMQLYKNGPSNQIGSQDPYWTIHKDDLTSNDNDVKSKAQARWAADWADAWTLGDYYKPTVKDESGNYTYTDYVTNSFTNLDNTAIVTNLAEIDDRDYTGYTDEAKARHYLKYNTNVRIYEGAIVAGYAYGGGLGDADIPLSGDTYGNTYISLLGGTVEKDLYAAGTTGAVYDLFGVRAYDATEDPTTHQPKNPYGFTASANAYIKGGSARNVYGGGWKGNVGAHIDPTTHSSTNDITSDPTYDIPGETHVVIGDIGGTSFTNGIPAVQRNAYGGGEGGAVFGTANITLNNGYIGYVHLKANEKQNEKGQIVEADVSEGLLERYDEKIIDETHKVDGVFAMNTNLEVAGNLFGGGYVDNSTVDKTNVLIYGGHVRNDAFGGGEVAAIGRGDMKPKEDKPDEYELKGIYRPGKTHIEMYGGHVHSNVYGGGRGYDNLKRHGSLNSDGYIFGQTEVHIHGGEIGTVSGVADGDGNVFGGCDIGHVYSAYENADGTFGKGVHDGVRYDGLYQGYYFKHKWNNESITGITYDADGFVMEENGTYTAEEAAAYNTANNLSSGDAGYKSAGDKKYERQFTEDCKVLIEPALKVKGPVNIGDRGFDVGEYVPIEYLNKLKNKYDYNKESGIGDSLKWICLDESGIIIHNAVFAGGNAPSGSTGASATANTASVFGNATASVHDIYHRDMITLGTRHTGGLYGDGNLTLVDGYRELNITNYGTDYYSIAKEITIGQYRALPDREADYYELKYTCMKECEDKDGTKYKPEQTENGVVKSKASTITADEMQTLFVEEKEVDGKTKKVSVIYGGEKVVIFDETEGEWVPNPAAGYWVESGVLPVYAGRLMNSIQRADFCGVYGSRMVMQGAQDRVIDKADYTNYTINRVREVSLNKKESDITGDAYHGNYFGIYNIVNYLGALTSDVDMDAVRNTDNEREDPYKKKIKIDSEADSIAYGTASYYQWKQAHVKDKYRNNGSSHNKVALASGVYLELTTEESKGDSLYGKVWGPITGVVELDLINVSTGIGGGFVYAQNLHGKRTLMNRKNTTLTKLNEGAVTKWKYEYDADDDDKEEWQTSGNFVHSTQTIIDDCYNISSKYKTGYKRPDGVPAHYWYIKGSVYVYDQYISAYTGTPNAYSEVVDIPLNISAASHGKIKLLNVQPNLYAYYAKEGEELAVGKRIVINDKSYYKNDSISYWDWSLLSKSEQKLFVKNTYTNCITCKIDGVEYKAGTYIMDDDKFTTYKSTAHTYTDADNKPIQKADKSDADDDYIFRSSNNVSHDTGYILTYEVTNPSKWDNWYSPKNTSDGGKITLADYNTLNPTTTTPGETTVLGKDAYYDGPTYRIDPSKITLDANGYGGILLGQRYYDEGALIAKSVEDTYQAVKNGNHSTAIPEDPVETDPDYTTKRQATFDEAYILTSDVTITEGTGASATTRHLNAGATISEAMKTANSDRITDANSDEAYLCTKTIQVTKEDIIYKDSKMTKTKALNYISDVETKMTDTYKAMELEKIKALPTTGTGAITAEEKAELVQFAILRDELKAYLVSAYYCTQSGLYGGDYYETGKNYRGLEAWSSLSQADHDKFIYNYDALDLLIDPEYTNSTTSGAAYSEGHKYQYDGNYTTEDQVKDASTGNKAGYSITQSVDYTVTYNDNELDLGTGRTVVVKRYNETDGIYKDEVVQIIKKDDELARDVYEGLVNEQRHYASIVVKNGKLNTTTNKYTVYVANASFVVGGTPYALGETISSETFVKLPDGVPVTTLQFDASEVNNTYYYCREEYPKGSSTITPITSHIVSGESGGLTSDNKVKVGTLISSGEYGVLPNEQKDFTIHGVSPTETSTLYVSRESDIHDLTRGKIITVVYQYDYDETDSSGNVTPVSERHVLNIHLSFKSGVPVVEDIEKPEIILPGDFISIGEPNVTPGAYEVTGGGWELFESQSDAESHTNGIDINLTDKPLYWYQDDWYVAYYAKSYLGRTYSNAVPVSVANYHDLANVMADKNKTHHMYIDNKDVKREPKIYINDYSKINKNGLDELKRLFDLSVLTYSSSDLDEDGLLKSDTFEGHKPLDSRVKGAAKLEFFLRTDIDYTDNPSTDDWTPIGDASQCFDGVLHGDGHTISGLDHSLFGELCGEVYNLGVTGSFNTAGVADTDEHTATDNKGYVESCWVKTSDTTNKTVGAVFGKPTGSGYPVVNCYYPESNKYTNKGATNEMADDAFYNGEVAYDLNNFYLHKRYAIANGTLESTNRDDRYLTLGADNTLTIQPYKKYEKRPDICSTGHVYNDNGTDYTLMYVEDRFSDGDFRFAGGSIPTSLDDRYYTETVKDKYGKDVEVSGYYPIWPDDYLFFGQKLTYGWGTTAHQNLPSAIVKTDGRLPTTDQSNRVYRAPAYYRSSDMNVAHFNPEAFLAQKSYDGTKLAHPNMTAIDFAGHYENKAEAGKYHLGWYNVGTEANRQDLFYLPLLDDDGLTDITNCDETKNLLVYAPAETAESGYANKKTHDVLNGYFVEQVYEDYYDNSDSYRLVHEANTSLIRGHLVQNDLTATNDHLLVDKQDFNCPIAYSFTPSTGKEEGTRMWYQRTPDNFVDHGQGWESVSLPFTAELVTTHQKGEITHFYSGSETSKNGTGSKIGHEYWLREFKSIKEEGTAPNFLAKAQFDYPTATGADKTVTNHFLWDYYYEGSHGHKDKNSDIYQKYYKNNRTYTSYPLLSTATPYLIGFPGQTYYEFDLSGSFEAQNTGATAPAKLATQVITFASSPGITVGVSDTDMSHAVTLTSDKNKNYSFTFKPNYLKEDLGTTDYLLKADGSQFDKVEAEGGSAVTGGATILPFRPFFTATSSAKNGVKRDLPNYIVFSGDFSEPGEEEPESALSGDLVIYAQGRDIITTSYLKEPIAIRITSVNGVTITNYALQPGQTITTPMNTAGAYIVNKKKIFIK